MSLAAALIARGEAASMPAEYRVYLVAARYGQSPAQVREWPADDFTVACRLLGCTS